YVDLPTVGSVFHKDEVLCTLESVKSVEEVLCPVAAAEVLETNVKVEDTPDLVNLDPEHDGWLVRIHYEGDVEADGKNFFSEEEYRKGHSVEVFE
ncbi:Glycine cleavage system H protein, putative, partial [Perkinsus marinus ATCC 50983]